MLKPAPDNAVVSSGYGARAPILTSAGWTASFHHGIDYKVNGPDGRGVAFPVTAAADGVVIPTRFSVQSVGAAGVTLHHKDGTSTFYGHMRFKTVNVGDQVKAGDVIGIAGREGFATGIHLHFELLRNPPGSRGWLDRSNRINPAGALSSRPAPKPEAPDVVPFPIPEELMSKTILVQLHDPGTANHGNVFRVNASTGLLHHVDSLSDLDRFRRVTKPGDSPGLAETELLDDPAAEPIQLNRTDIRFLFKRTTDAFSGSAHAAALRRVGEQ